jgi:hypothetical protein
LATHRSSSIPRRSLIGVVLLVAALVSILALALDIASVNPQGLADARPLFRSDAPRLEPLYGAVWTPTASISWSPDGRFIAVGGGIVSGIAILDASTGRTVRSWSVPGDIYVVRWSPDGARLAVGNELGFIQSPGWVYIYSPNGTLETSWQAHTWFVGGLAWSPDGTKIVTTSNTRYAIWDVATHNRLWLDTNASSWGDSVDWSPDGRLLAFGSNAGPSIYDAISHKLVYEPSSTAWDERGVAWSHRGDRVATANLAGCANVVTFDGRTVWDSLNPVVGPSGPTACGVVWASNLAWDPSDAMIAVPTTAGIRIFDAADGKPLATLVFPVAAYSPSTVIATYGWGESRDWAAAWSPSGGSIASVGTMSHPSFRMWGIRRSAVSVWIEGFEATFAVGLPLAVGSGFVVWVRKPLRSPGAGTLQAVPFAVGAVLLPFAFVIAVLQWVALEFLGRTYGGWVVPPPSWFAENAALSLLLAVPPVVASIPVFRAIAWPTGSDSRPRNVVAARVLGIATLPVGWCLAIGFLALSLALTLGVKNSPELTSSITAVAGGIGVLLAANIVSAASRSSVRRSLVALLVAAGVSIALSLLGFLLLLLLLRLFLVVPTGDLAVYGIQVNFGFGIAPWIAAVIFLPIAAAGAFVESPPMFLWPLYSRLRGKDILSLQSRREVLDYLERHPGTHFRELLRSLPLGSGNLYYQLAVLVREGFVIARRDRMYRRFFLVPSEDRGTP